MTIRGLLVAVAVAALGAPALGQQPQAPQPPAPAPSQTSAPLRVHIYAGLKTHGEGQHDYPQFLADWSKILTQRGAYVTGGLQFPSARDLATVDVMVIYKGDAGYLGIEDRATLDAYIRRGGGLVSIHDALCGPEPEHFASILGGAKKHGEVNYTLEADVPYTVVDPGHPIMQGISSFTIKDEAFFRMTWSEAPPITVLATATMADTPSAQGQKVVGQAVPQIWTYERSLAPAPTGQPYRAFVWMQGHNYSNFTHPDVQKILLRGISWAGKRPVDELATVRPPRGGGRGTNPQGRGGRRGSGN
ncbi:MAG TPA: ThuA domain-containing protein [Vicinamibacterales bacterium]|nr:ThuA domain-containing protein [Vicinamibacterales bacterium]